ncbi:MAG: thiamine-phosphate kinase [Candidatus Omnitrophica bacterium]|nr:thiamine-phosphate kinase [Candidatus Omnitrophota bacterium]
MHTVAQIGEAGLIRRITRRLARPSSVLVGIGDDTAVLRRISSGHLLFASDMLIEGVHFRKDLEPHRIGWKALACNISDVAVMGGWPAYAVVSLGLPSRTPVRVVDGLYDGLRQCAMRFGVAVVGGDTVRAPCLVIDVAIVGTVRPSRLVRRSGAKVGDRIMVTGRLGGSLLSGRHATFVPRLREAQWLLKHVPVHAMMDLSDGLARDLWQLARASRVTIQIREDAIPSTQAAQACRRRSCRCRVWGGRRAVWHALMDGEDFELLFTVPSRAARRLPRAIGRVPVTEIGTVTAKGTQVRLMRQDGRAVPLAPEGFKHF